MRTRAGSDRIRNSPPRAPPPPPEPMPAVGARRSTRVFVPKATPKPQPPKARTQPARVGRSGKRLAFTPSDSDNSHWTRWEPNANHNDDHQDERGKGPKPPTSPQLPLPPPPERAFGAVYKRKRRQSDPSEADRRFGIVFTRKDKRRKLAPFRRDGLAAAIPCSLSREFAASVGLLDSHLLTLLDSGAAAAAAAGADIILALVDGSCPGSLHQFLLFLLPLLRRVRQGRVQSLAPSILSSPALVDVFASRGLHFLRLQRRIAVNELLQRSIVHLGWCELRGADRYQHPVLSVNFSALPSYFQGLHLVLALNSIYLPAVIRRAMGFVSEAEEACLRDHSEADISESLGAGDAAEPHRLVQDYAPLEQAAGVVVHGLRLKKHQRKRTSARHPLGRRRLVARFPVRANAVKQGTVASQTVLKPALTEQEDSGEPVQPKPALEVSLDLLENMDDSDVSTPMGPNGMQKRYSFKSPVAKEKLALSEVRQNIDTFQCKANLLIIQADRGWREEGALVMLELSNSNGWCVAVKLHGVTRISLKPSEQRFYVVNRVTNAYVWQVEDGWKLEFPDKWDWLLFKEMHIEGRERNSQAKIIPIPGVNEISGRMEGTVKVPFTRPVPDYIRTVDDEIARALSLESAYDMDSEDEQWLIQLKHGASDRRSTRQNHISFEDFERIISLLEKDAYSNPEENNDVDQLLSRYPALGKGDNVLAVYQYWVDKRCKKGAPLLRIFQGAPLRRGGRLSQKASVKKKRSFKRQKSQTGRGKPGFFLQGNAEEESALQRVVDAERAAKQAREKAVQLRARAQALMANANLAAYKSVMALRIAEAASISDSYRDLVCKALLD